MNGDHGRGGWRRREYSFDYSRPSGNASLRWWRQNEGEKTMSRALKSSATPYRLKSCYVNYNVTAASTTAESSSCNVQQSRLTTHRHKSSRARTGSAGVSRFVTLQPPTRSLSTFTYHRLHSQSSHVTRQQPHSRFTVRDSHSRFCCIAWSSHASFLPF